MKFIKRVIPKEIKSRLATFRHIWNLYYHWPKQISKGSSNIEVYGPVSIDPQFIEIENFTRIQPNVTLITSAAKLKIKKYSAIGAGCLIVPGNHTPTVGLPQYLSYLHINDVQRGITINEDCWIGAEVALLSKCEIGRGAVVGARSVVTKNIPPYAVVVGMPARIIGSRFTVDQIIEHERTLYPEQERLSKEFLTKLFEDNFRGLKAIGTSDISAKDRELLCITKEKNRIYPY